MTTIEKLDIDETLIRIKRAKTNMKIMCEDRNATYPNANETEAEAKKWLAEWIRLRDQKRKLMAHRDELFKSV